jgi:hypothetical protein
MKHGKSRLSRTYREMLLRTGQSHYISLDAAAMYVRSQHGSDVMLRHGLRILRACDTVREELKSEAVTA